MAKRPVPKKNLPKSSQRQLKQMAMDLKAIKAKVIAPATVKTAEWARWKCPFSLVGKGNCIHVYRT